MACKVVIIGDVSGFPNGYPLGVQKGDIINIRAPGPLPAKMQPPKIVTATITNRRVAELRPYMLPWERSVSFSIDSHNAQTDTYTVTATADITASGDVSAWKPGGGALVRAEIEGFLRGWKAVVIGEAANAITFTLSIYDALRSRAFFQYPSSVLFDLATWSEAYDEASGRHTVTLDYSGLEVNPTNLENRVEKLGDVVDHQDGEIEYTADRAAIWQTIQAEIQDLVRGPMVTDRQFHRYGISASDVDTLIGLGGNANQTFAQFAARVTDKLA